MTQRIPPHRLRLEMQSMAASGATLVACADGRLVWLETLTSNRGNEYDVVIEYTASFPHERPHAVIAAPSVRADAPHRYADGVGTLCLFPSPFDESLACTAGAVRARAALWIHCYEHWLTTGAWYAPELRH